MVVDSLELLVLLSWELLLVSWQALADLTWAGPLKVHPNRRWKNILALPRPQLTNNKSDFDSHPFFFFFFKKLFPIFLEHSPLVDVWKYRDSETGFLVSSVTEISIQVSSFHLSSLSQRKNGSYHCLGEIDCNQSQLDLLACLLLHTKQLWRQHRS